MFEGWLFEDLLFIKLGWHYLVYIAGPLETKLGQLLAFKPFFIGLIISLNVFVLGFSSALVVFGRGRVAHEFGRSFFENHESLGHFLLFGVLEFDLRLGSFCWFFRFLFILCVLFNFLLVVFPLDQTESVFVDFIFARV